MEQLTQEDVRHADAVEMTLLSQALELSGQGVIVLTKNGRVLLISPPARAWLAECFGASPSRQANRLPDSLRRWRKHQEVQLGGADDVPPPRTLLVVERDGKRLMVRHLCSPKACHLLLEERSTALEPAFLESLGLTRREGEVLLWVAQGETNTEIGTIVGVSPRTVQKHLQHVFEKLGVETRTAAATLALGWRSEPWAAPCHNSSLSAGKGYWRQVDTPKVQLTVFFRNLSCCGVDLDTDRMAIANGLDYIVLVLSLDTLNLAVTCRRQPRTDYLFRQHSYARSLSEYSR